MSNPKVDAILASMEQGDKDLRDFKCGRIKSDLTTTEAFLGEHKWVSSSSQLAAPGLRLTVNYYEGGKRYFFMDLEEDQP